MLGDVEFGKFSFALALAAIFETLMDFGLHQVTIRAVARDRSQATDLLHQALGIKLVWAVGAFTALIVAATVLRPEWDVRYARYMMGGSLVLRSYMLTIRGVRQGLERFGWDSIVVGADRGILLVFRGRGARVRHGPSRSGDRVRGRASNCAGVLGLDDPRAAWLTRPASRS